MSKDFTSFYERELLPALQELEVSRKYNLQLFIKIAIAAVFMVLIVGTIHLYMYPLEEWMLIIGGVLLFAGTIILYSFKKKPIRDDFKKKVITNLVKYVNEDLVYDSHKSIPRGEYMRSKLFRRRPDRYSGEDFAAGKLDKTAIEFSEIHSEYKQTTRDSKGRTRTTWHTIFKGIFVIADFHKDFKSNTLVVPDTAESLFGGFGRRLQKLGASFGELVEMENVDFEKEFAVYSYDQIEARYILSPVMMERILEYRKKWKRDIYLSFVNSKVYIAIPESENLFEPSFFSRLDNKEYYERMVSYLDLIIDVVESLNLNVRIWTKD